MLAPLAAGGQERGLVAAERAHRRTQEALRRRGGGGCVEPDGGAGLRR